MSFRLSLLLVTALAVYVAPLLCAQAPASRPVTIPLNGTTKFEMVNARIKWVDYRGRPALYLGPLEGHEHDTDQEMVAILTDTDFGDGVIEVDLSGARRAGYPG